nr:uncharacterized protein LOC113395562 [Vanessa tameamea]
MLLSVNLSHITEILMFEILWIRMRLLRRTMDSFSSVSDSDNEEQEAMLTTTLTDYLIAYKNILDNNKTIGHATKLLMVFNLPFCFSVLLFFTDLISRNILELQGNISITLEFLINIFLTLLPALFGELANAEAEKIKDHLTKQHRVCNIDALRKKILDAMKFLEIRPMNFTVWRVFTVDLSLPLSIVSVFITYTIVLLQFNQVKT